MADATTSTRGRDPESIRRDIEHNRDDMDETVSALGDRLSPGRLVDEAWQRMRGGDSGGLGAAVRDHPVPLALMGLGVAWLAIEQTRGRGDDDHVDPGTWGPAEGRRGPYGPDAVDHDDPDWEHGEGGGLRAGAARVGERARDLKDRAADAASSVKAKAGDAAASMKERTSGAAGSVKSGAHHLREGSPDVSEVKARVAERATHAKDRARHAGEKARQGFWHLLEDSPLTVGAITFGLGLASGLAAPSTRAEDRALGRTADTLKDEAGRVGRETADKARRVAQDATGAALDEAHRQVEEAGEEGGRAREAASELADEARTAARNVGRAAKEAAGESAEREDLTTEHIKREAKKAGERTRAEAEAERRRKRREGGDDTEPRH